MELNKIYTSDSEQGLKTLPDKSINCCVTSPPYFNLRNYGCDGQIGLEQSPEEYINKLVDVFREVKRVLKANGTLWVNIGDSYNGSGKAHGDKYARICKQDSNRQSQNLTPTKIDGLKSKDLIGIPWMLAFALRADGWYLRQDIIWSKPNPMPESVNDRCTKSHEYIFLLSKSAKYYYDSKAIKTPLQKSSDIRLAQNILAQKGSDRVPGKINGKMKAAVGDPMFRVNTQREYTPNLDLLANKKSVWNVATKPFRDAHFATFPSELIVDCIKAGCPRGGGSIRPFHGIRNYCHCRT